MLSLLTNSISTPSSYFSNATSLECYFHMHNDKIHTPITKYQLSLNTTRSRIRVSRFDRTQYRQLTGIYCVDFVFKFTLWWLKAVGTVKLISLRVPKNQIHIMCIKSLLTNGLIVTIFGVLFTVFMATFGWIGVPQIIDDIGKKVCLKKSSINFCLRFFTLFT